MAELVKAGLRAAKGLQAQAVQALRTVAAELVKAGLRAAKELQARLQELVQAGLQAQHTQAATERQAQEVKEQVARLQVRAGLAQAVKEQLVQAGLQAQHRQEAKEQLARLQARVGLAQEVKEQLARLQARVGLAQGAKEQLARLQVRAAMELPEEPAAGLRSAPGKDLQAKQLGAQEALQEQGLQAAG